MPPKQAEDAALSALCETLALARALSERLPGADSVSHGELVEALQLAHVCAKRLAIEQGGAKRARH